MFDLGLPLPGIEKAEDNIFHCKINVNKLHKYPGFNAPPPSDSVDVRRMKYIYI